MPEPIARTRHHCPLCDWHLDAPDPDPFPAVTPEWLAAAQAEHPQYADDPVLLALLARNEPIEAEIRAHLETHTLLEWVQEVMRLRAALAARDEPVACTCAQGGYGPHGNECAITAAWAAPMECACGDVTGVPHPHPRWRDSSPRVLSSHPAHDGRSAEIRP